MILFSIGVFIGAAAVWLITLLYFWTEERFGFRPHALEWNGSFRDINGTIQVSYQCRVCREIITLRYPTDFQHMMDEMPTVRGCKSKGEG
ncbi:hypothetical protein [Brevibacillus migulae]|uniref:hypothetical protein n=1 Tax=Brevibacillus migulae TaxID=1644114 RepID=UPI00106E780A|nr:hypothetical protein [Brevibacillus migulae]